MPPIDIGPDQFHWDFWNWFDRLWDDGPLISPVILDLDGNGIKIDPLTSSNTYFDMAGGGFQHRTAWAGAGDAVLAFDANNDGVIDQKNEIVFTEWDPSATSDMQALRDVFDTNHNGRLDSGDAQFSQFKLLVTNADGTQTLETLGQAGVASIDLKEDNSSRVFADGSSIDGQTTFTRTDGTTGTAASVSFVTEALGYRLQTARTVDGAGTVDNKAFDPDGGLANETISITSADGRSKTLKRDVDGDGVIDLVQTDVTIVNGDGSSIETLSDTTAAGVLLDRTVTTTSADRRSITIQRDLDGGGIFGQTERLITAADGSKSDTVSNFSRNGALINATVTTTSADGSTRADRIDENGDGVWDRTSTDATVVNGDGSRTETIADVNADGSSSGRTVVRTSADGLAKMRDVDVDGNGTTDLSRDENIVRNADGSYWVTQTDRNGDGSTRDATAVVLSADNLSKTSWLDVNGDGIWDRITIDTTIVASDGGRIETTTDYNGNGSKRDQTFVTRGADGRTRAIQIDQNGDGTFDSVETIVVSAGFSADVVSSYNADGSLISRSAVSTSADGLWKATQIDSNGDGVFDLTTQSSILLNADGSSTQTTADTNANGSLRDQTTTWTSADGLSKTTWIDIDGDGAWDTTNTDVISLGVDGGSTETITNFNADGSRRDKSIIIVSSDRKTTSITRDVDGDNIDDQRETIALQVDGATIDTISNLNADGSVKSQHVSTTTANGLSTTIVDSATVPQWWGPFYTTIGTSTDVTVLNNDGSRTETFTLHNGDANGPVQEQIVATTSADGLSQTTLWSRWNGGSYVNETSTDVTTLGADGSTTRVVTTLAPNGQFGKGGSATPTDRSVTTVSGSGLSTTAQLDINSDGAFDTTDVTATGVDGSSVETLTSRNLDGSLRIKDVLTTSWDGRSSALQRDSDGDGANDHYETRRIEENGARIDIVWDSKADGSLKGRVVTTTAADGLSKTVQLDTNGDGTIDWSQSATETLDTDGSRTVTISDFNGNGSLRDRTITTTSADGLSKAARIDANGRGNAIETETDITIQGADGRTTRTVTGHYADGSLKNKTVTSVSANGRSISTTIDLDGDGVVDRTDATSVTIDGIRSATATYKDGSSVTTTTSFDGRTTTMTSSSGVTQTTTSLADASGSYSWSSSSSNGNSLGSSSHTIDSNNVDTYSFTSPNANGTVRIDAASEQRYSTIVERLYDSAFDRSMTIDEKELFGRYINASTGSLNTTQLANDLMSSTEFSTRYGSLTNLEFIERIYQNAFGRSASISDLAGYLTQLNAGVSSRADIMIALSASVEHIAGGNVHATTNNSVVSAAAYSLDHTTDRQIAADEISRLYDTAVGRDSTSSELSSGVQKIVGGSATEAQIANDLLSVTWVYWPYISNPSLFDQTYGALSNADFVTRLFLNAVGRNPTAQESSTWVAMLDNNTVTRADVLYAIAESPDHLSSVGAEAGQAVTASYQTLYFGANATANITGGGNTIYGSGGDILTIGGNGATGVDNFVDLSNGAANLSDDSHMDVFGSGNAIHVGKYSNVGIDGDNNSLTAGSGNGIWVNGGVGNVVNASGDTIFVAANVGVGVIGGGDTVIGQAGSRIDVAGNGPDGSSNTVNVSNGFVNLADHTRADVHGTSDTIGLGNNDVLSVAGDGNRITFGAEDRVGATGNSNTFVFHSNFGHDAIDGFNSTDSLQFDQSVFADWAHLLGAAHQSGADTIIAADATNTITLQNVALSSLNQNQFHFS